MPFFVQFGTNLLPAAGQLAQNAGQYQVGQDQFNNGLKANAQAMEQARFQDQQQTGQEDLQYKYDALDALNNRSDATNQNRTDIASMRSSDQAALQKYRSQAALGLLSEKDKAAMDRLAARIDSQTQIAGDNRDQRYYNTDQNNARGYYGIDTRATTAANGQANQSDIEAQREAMVQAHIDATTAQRQLDAQARQEALAGRMQNAQKIAAARMRIDSIKAELEAASHNFDTAGMADATRRLREASTDPFQLFQGQAPQRSNAPPPAMQQPAPYDNGDYGGETSNPAPMQPAPAQPVNPAPPTQVHGADGTIWIFTGQYDPQTGKPLYQSQQ